MEVTEVTTDQKESWQEKLARNWSLLRVAERTESLRQNKKRFDNVESLTRETRRYLMGDKVVTKTPEDEMHVGDKNITVHQESSIGKILLGAGLFAAGAGLSIAAYLASQPKPVAPVEQPANNTTINQGLDEDTTIQLTLPEWSE